MFSITVEVDDVIDKLTILVNLSILLHRHLFRIHCMLLLGIHLIWGLAIKLWLLNKLLLL